jgi:iron complex outermembrane receptor protein
MSGLKHCARDKGGLAVLACTIAVLFTSKSVPSASAQEASLSQERDEAIMVEEVFVTARRREVDLFDAASSVAVIGGQAAKDLRLYTLEEALTLTPNVTLETNQFTGRVNPQIRGVPNPPNTVQFEPSVAVYRNAAYISGAGLRGGQLVDIDRIEVLRGPQGGLWGRNAIAGALNVVFARPDFEETAFHFEAEASRFERYESWGSANFAVSDQLALRAVGWWTEQNDSETFNTALDEPLGGVDDKGIRLIAGMRPTTWWEATTEFEYNESSNTLRTDIGDVTQNAQLLFGIGDSISRSLTLDEVALNDPNINDDERLFLSHESVFSTHSGDIVLQVSFTDFEGFTSRDQDFTDADAAASLGLFETVSNVAVESEDIFAELRYASPADRALRFQAGVSYLSQDIFQDGAQPNLVDIPDPIEGAFGLPVVGPATATGNFEFDQDLESTAAFLEAEYELTEGLTASIAGRYTEDEKSALLAQNLTGDPGPVALFSGFLPTLEVNLNETFDNTSFAADLRYRVNDNVNLHAAVAEGFRAGGVNEIASSVATAVYDPETSIGYEVGFRSRWLGGKLSVNATAFFQTIDDVLLFVPDPTIVTIASAINGGESETRGFEIDSAWTPSARLSFTAAVGYADAELTSLSDEAANANAEVGNRPAGAAEWTAALTGVFEQPITDRLQAFASFSMSYEDGAFNNINNAPEQERGSIYLLNLTGGLQFDEFRVVAFIDNVTEDRYSLLRNQLNGIPTAGTLSRESLPRTYGVRLFADF